MPAKKFVAAANHAQTCNHEIKELCDFSPVSEKNSDVEMGSFLELKHASIQMFSDTEEIFETAIPAKVSEVADHDVNDEDSEKADDSDMEIPVMGDLNGDVIVDVEAFLQNASLLNGEYSSNSYMVSNSVGINNSMYARLSQSLDILNSGSAGAFDVDEHQWYLEDTGTISGVFCQGEHEKIFNQCPLQIPSFSPADQPQNCVAANSEVKKKLFILSTVLKWLLRIDSMSVHEGNDSQIN